MSLSATSVKAPLMPKDARVIEASSSREKIVDSSLTYQSDFKSFAFDDDLMTNLSKVNFEVEAEENIQRLFEKFTEKMPEKLKKLEAETQDGRSKLESKRAKTQEMKSSYDKLKTPTTEFEKEEANIKDHIKSLQDRLVNIQEKKKKAIEEKDALVQQRKEIKSIEDSLSTSLRAQFEKKMELEQRKVATRDELKVFAKKHQILRLNL
ncbi:hypothetical protein VNO78_25636 [Psophocarpus tetragonolobus]|uniref:Uncharacterized protein n=1 Tax=Psophocarpus tetragonolobus TaxID=3891 RepID=A0AAN9SAH4_PSOTE